MIKMPEIVHRNLEPRIPTSAAPNRTNTSVLPMLPRRMVPIEPLVTNKIAARASKDDIRLRKAHGITTMVMATRTTEMTK
jgi:hypothetical protein